MSTLRVENETCWIVVVDDVENVVEKQNPSSGAGTPLVVTSEAAVDVSGELSGCGYERHTPPWTYPLPQATTGALSRQRNRVPDDVFHSCMYEHEIRNSEYRIEERIEGGKIILLTVTFKPAAFFDWASSAQSLFYGTFYR